MVSIEQLKSSAMAFWARLDCDITFLYAVETRLLNQAVKRNAERFPSGYCFQLTDEEFEKWKSQIVMSNSDKMGLRRNPFAFTERGVAMLSTVISESCFRDFRCLFRST